MAERIIFLDTDTFASHRYRVMSSNYGKLLRDLREQQGLTQDDVARRLGTTQANIGKKETGQRGIDIDEFVRWAGVLGYFPGDLLENSAGDIGQLLPILRSLRGLSPHVLDRIGDMIHATIGIRNATFAEALRAREQSVLPDEVAATGTDGPGPPRLARHPSAALPSRQHLAFLRLTGLFAQSTHIKPSVPTEGDE